MFGLGIVRRAKAFRDAVTPSPTIRLTPGNPIAWITEADRQFDQLSETTRTRITAYELQPASLRFQRSAAGISKGARSKLRELSRRPLKPETIDLAIEEILRWMTIVECTTAFRASGYFGDAEPAMQEQWDQIIWPIIQRENFDSVIDLACGHGRNSEHLCHHAKTIDLVDVNETAIEACRLRFGDQKGDCRFRYHVTDGNGLSAIPDASISFVYSWDSMVHFERAVVRSYVMETARVLKASGSAFLHTSNYGTLAPHSDWAANHGGRSDMTADLILKFAKEAGLQVKFHRLSGIKDGRSIDDLDCVTLLSK